MSDVSPAAQGYIHHARVFFKRAATIIEAILAKLDSPTNATPLPEGTAEAIDDWRQTLGVRHQAARQVQLFATGVSFVLSYRLSPVGARAMQEAYGNCARSVRERAKRLQRRGRCLEVHAIVGEMMELNQGEGEEMAQQVWHGKRTAEEWYPPASFLVSWGFGRWLGVYGLYLSP